MGPILNGYGAMGVFFVINSHLWTTRRMSQYEILKRLEQVESVIVTIRNPQLASRAVHNRAAAWFAAGGGTF